ncbi:DUF6660 family protein [Cerina litoralis]|uniref:DUF6660 family protein n=1 Tax=Cerina litoralis TaxID=2874477 RepID=UPI0037C1725B
MKLLAYILSIYFLGLILVPCGDNATAADLDENFIVSQLDIEHNHGHSDDQCSPFCQCHCCHVNVIYSASNPHQIITVEISSVQPFHFNRRALDFIPSILQPPKI